MCHFVSFIAKNCDCWLILENQNDDGETLFLPGCHYWWSDRWLTSCINELSKLHLRGGTHEPCVNAAFFITLRWPDAKIAVIREQWTATASLSFYCLMLFCCALNCVCIPECMNSKLKRWGEAWYDYSWNLSWQFCDTGTSGSAPPRGEHRVRKQPFCCFTCQHIGCCSHYL